MSQIFIRCTYLYEFFSVLQWNVHVTWTKSMRHGYKNVNSLRPCSIKMCRNNLFSKTILRFWFKDIFIVCVWFSDLLSLNEPRMTRCFYIYIFDTYCVYIRGYSWLFRIGPIYGQYQIGWSDTVALKNLWMAERRSFLLRSYCVHRKQVQRIGAWRDSFASCIF
jgi:hypothetical protein